MKKDTLQSLGLATKESAAYLAILENGSVTQTNIAKLTGINRTTLYKHITSLLQRGYITQTIQGKRIFYVAENPTSILKQLNKQKQNLEKVLPSLLATYTNVSHQPTITRYEGADGILQVLTKTVEEANYLKTFFSPNKFFEVFTDTKTSRKLANTIHKRNLLNKGLCSDTPEGKKWLKDNKTFFTGARLIPSGLSFPIECIITNKQVIVVSYEHRFAVTIESPDIKIFFETMFDHFWKIAKK